MLGDEALGDCLKRGLLAAVEPDDMVHIRCSLQLILVSEQKVNKNVKDELTSRGRDSYFVRRWGGCSVSGRAALGRRKSRYDRLFRSDVEAIILDALELRQTVLAAQLNLKTNGEMYWRLNGLVERLHEVMGAVAGREPDFRAAWLGLLPLPEDYSDRT